MNCRRFNSCKDPAKRYNYLCSRWEATPAYGSLIELFDSTLASNPSPTTWAPSDESSDSDLEALVDSILSQQTVLPPDVRIDDRDLKQAPNFWAYISDPAYVGGEQLPFPKQFQIALQALSEYCPRCSDTEYLENIPTDAPHEEILEKVVLLHHGKCPSCGVGKSELVLGGELLDHYEIAGLAGQRGGKTAVVSMISSYNHHRFLKVQSPNKLYKLRSEVTLISTFAALTFQQAKENLWDPFLGIIRGGAWYQNYHQMLDYYGNKYGEELYKMGEEMLRYRHRNLLSYASGPNMKTMRGRTRFDGGIDEIGFFNHGAGDKGVKSSAEEVYTAMKNSYRTLRSGHMRLRQAGFDNIPGPMFSNISSPYSISDKIVDLYRQSRKSKIIYGFKFATWEMNPTIKREDLNEEFEKNPVNAMRDYGAEPPLSASGFIQKLAHTKEIFSKTPNAIVVTPRRIKAPGGKRQTSARVSFNWRDNSVAKILAIDAGYVNNSFAFAVGHCNQETMHPIMDAFGEVMPTPDCPINFHDLCSEVLVRIIRDLSVTMVVSDRWQNIKLLQDLQAETGVDIEEHRLKYGDFDHYRQHVFDGTLQVPALEMKPKIAIELGDTGQQYPTCFQSTPVAHYLFQLMTVQDYPGETVEKGDKFTDDIFRASVLAHSYLTDIEYAERFAGPANLRRPISIGAVALASSGGANLAPTSANTSKVGVIGTGGAANGNVFSRR